MPDPSIEVLGVYRLSITDDLIQEQADLLFGSDQPESERAAAERRCREQLESAVLVEVVVRNPNRKFSVDDFTQPDSDQAPWLDVFLTPDGEAISDEPLEFRKPPRLDSYRISFYMHFWDPDRPLQTSYGDISCPPPTDMPRRLKQLVPYEPLD